MRAVTYSTEALQEAFAEHTVLTLPMVAKALGTPCRMTWFRKLKELDYRVSYTHQNIPATGTDPAVRLLAESAGYR